MAGIHRCHRQARGHARIGQHRAPGVDHHGVAVALAAAVVEARLGRGQHVGGVFDRPGLEQHLPVVLAGEGGEGSRNHQQIGPAGGQVAVELRKAHVVADG